MQWWVGGRRGSTISLAICLTCVGRSRFRVFMHAFVKGRSVQKTANGQPGLRAMVTVICYMASQGHRRDSCDRAGGAIEVVAGARASRRRNTNRAKISNSHPRSIFKKVQKKSHHKWFWAPIPPHPLPLPRASGGLSLSLSLLSCVSEASRPLLQHHFGFGMEFWLLWFSWLASPGFCRYLRSCPPGPLGM